MNYFLEELARHCLGDEQQKIKRLFVFPNRRSSLFFKKYYASQAKSPGWLPATRTIQDFMTELSGLSPADPLELSFLTYQVYREVSGSRESFDEFFPWGEMMISDFNDIDNYQVEARDLFTNLSDLKKLESGFDYLNEEQKALIKRFWSFFETETLSEHQEIFLKMWDLLFPVYEGLRTLLYERNMAYEGMIYRHVAEDDENLPVAFEEFERIAFIGFNALNSCEKHVFNTLMKAGRAEFYWDYDERYMDSPIEEAGRFIRENYTRFPPVSGFDPGFRGLSEKKKLRIYNIPSDILQCKVLGEELDAATVSGFNTTAVILGNEELMGGILTSLPAGIDNLNISMGYPLTQTLIFSFIDSVLQLQQNLKKEGGHERYYFKNVLMILTHQYMQNLAPEKARDIAGLIRRGNMIYVPSTVFSNSELLALIFRKMDSPVRMNTYLRTLLRHLLGELSKSGRSDRGLDREYIYHLLTRVNKLDNLSREFPFDYSLDNYIRLLRKLFRSLRIPFNGEPLHGLQVMGILESRLLDFKNVHVLSLNEGTMPEHFPNYSYIPSNLRYGFGLPTREDKDAIYAYYFYRLLQRAEKVNLYYNGKSDGLNQGEPSRYIHQLKYLYSFDTLEMTIGFRVSGQKEAVINIPKSPGIMKVLMKYSPEGESYLSPSALGTYLDCPLRFYFTYVAGMREEEEVTEEIDAAGFGNLYHKTMERLYEDLSGKMVNRAQIESKLPEVEKYLSRVFRDEFLNLKGKSDYEMPEGKNIITFEVIKRFVHQTLKRDMEYTPFRYLDSEQQVEFGFLQTRKAKKVRLGGKIDRLDEREGIIHIIDYKTGKNDLDLNSLEQLFDRDSWKNKKMKALFQIFVYAWIYRKIHGNSEISPCIYVSTELFSDKFSIYPVWSGKKGGRIKFGEIADEFEERLGLLVDEIFNTELTFSQTDDTDRCKYCPYADICHRSSEPGY